MIWGTTTTTTTIKLLKSNFNLYIHRMSTGLSRAMCTKWHWSIGTDFLCYRCIGCDSRLSWTGYLRHCYAYFGIYRYSSIYSKCWILLGFITILVTNTRCNFPLKFLQLFIFIYKNKNKWIYYEEIWWFLCSFIDVFGIISVIVSGTLKPTPSLEENDQDASMLTREPIKVSAYWPGIIISAIQNYYYTYYYIA